MKLKVTPRTIVGKKTKELRKEGNIPCIVYGKNLESPLQITCNKNDFIKLYKESGKSTVIEIEGEGIDQLALIHIIQTDPVSDVLLHVDFLAISKGQKVTTEVPLVFVGVSPLEKSGEGTIQTVRDTLEIEALPKDLPHDIEIDISGMETTNDAIFVRDIKAPQEVEILTDLDQPIVTASGIREEVEEETTEIEEETTTETETKEAATEEKSE